MSIPILPPLLPTADAAVLLVLLPPVAVGVSQPAPAATLAALAALQRQLGAAIQVLPIDQASHPAVVRSFDGQGLPAFILFQHGVELWHQQGLPDGESIVPLLLSKLRPAPDTARPETL